MKLQRLITFALPFGILAVPAFAGPPFNVDDPGTSEAKHTAIRLVYLSSQVRGSEAQQLSNLSLGYGLTQAVELDLAASENSYRNSGIDRVNGFGDINLGAKWRFQEETKCCPQCAFSANIKLPFASHRRGLGSGKTDYTPALIAAKSFGKAQLMANYGYNFLGKSDAQEKDNAYYGVALTYQATEALNVGVQLYGNNAAVQGGRSDLAYGLGVTDTLAPDRAFLFSIGRSARGFSDLNVYVGYQIVLGPKEVADTKGTDANTKDTDADTKTP